MTEELKVRALAVDIAKRLICNRGKGLISDNDEYGLFASKAIFGASVDVISKIDGTHHIVMVSQNGVVLDQHIVEKDVNVRLAR